MTHARSTRYAATCLAVLGILAAAEWRPRAAGTISGVVFEDFNGNGLRDTAPTVPNAGGATGDTALAVDRGVAGVTVSAYDGGGTLRGTAVSDASGAYALAATGTGPYRIEFTGLPAGYRPSAFATGAAGNGTTVQFVPDGPSTNVNLAILDPVSYCQNNPTLVTSCFVFGDQVTGANSGMPVLVDFPYSAGANTAVDADYAQPSTHTLMSPAGGLGTVFGVGYNRATNRVYASAFMKRHAGFGPNGPGAIYTVNPAAAPGGAPALFADLDAIFGAGTSGGDAHATNGGDYNRDGGNVTWNAVGKTSLGGLEVSPDGLYVFVVNLADRQVYRLPTTQPLTPATIVRRPVPVPASAVPASGADLRPFALQWFRGRLYVGMVNSAESTQLAANLRAYVYALDPATMTFAATPALEFSLVYPRGYAQNFNGLTAGEWNPWTPAFTVAPGAGFGLGAYPQPILAGLSFDVDGNLTVGIRDRAGDQFGFFTYDNPADVILYEGVAAGDTLFAQITTPGDLTSGWTLESNAATTRFGPTAGAGNAQGPGGGEYFFDETYLTGVVSQELTSGSVLQVPGHPDVVTSAGDPGRKVRTGGFMWMRQDTGVRVKAYELYDTGFAGPPVPTFSKANGLGEVAAMCVAAPIEIGNRLWLDTDGDGVQDPNENGLDGVTVQLVNAAGTTIATALTANGGQYYFSSAPGVSAGNAVYGVSGLTPNTAGFRVRVAMAQAPLAGYTVSPANADGSANGDSRDSDAVLAGTAAEVPFATGPAGANDHTFDLGFVPVPPGRVSLGNLVWLDLNDNGLVGAGEPGIDGAAVRLIAANGTTVLETTVTDATGHYLFTNLLPGTYLVEVVPPVGVRSSTDIATSANPNNDRDNDDNGVIVVGGAVRSGAVTLAVGQEPTNDGDGNPDSNLTVDFGFVPDDGGGFQADLCLQQTIPSSVLPGGQMTATYTATNYGPGAANDVVIDGMLPAGVTVASTVISPGGVCTATPTTLDCRWPGATPAGATLSVVINFQVSPSIPVGTPIWLWFMTSANNGDPYPACNMVDSYIFVGDGSAPVDLALTAVATSGSGSGPAIPATVGAPMSARFTVSNPSTAAASGRYVLLLDEAGVVDVTGATWSPQGSVVPSNSTSATWETGPIPAGGSVTLDLSLVPRASTATRVQLVRIAGQPVDPNAANDQAAIVLDAVGPGSGRWVAAGNLDGAGSDEIITGTGAGETPQVLTFSSAGAPLARFFAFDRGFRGGVRVASCDVNGDGAAEIVAAQGPGGGRVRVLSMNGGTVGEFVTFDAFEPSFTGGVNVACGDLDGDGRGEVVVGPDGGRAPDVRVFSVGPASATLSAQFQAYEPSFTGGVRVSARRFTGSPLVGAFNVVTAPGPGRAGDIRVWAVTGASAALRASAPLVGSTSGAQVLLADIDGDASLDLLVAPDAGSPALVQVFRLSNGAQLFTAAPGTGGLRSLRAAVGRFGGVPELVVGRGAGEAPGLLSLRVTGSGVGVRLSFTALEQP